MSISPLSAYLLLGLAIISEVTGSTFLVKSNGFTKPVPTTITLVCFCVAFYLLALVVKVIPLGVTYAIWSGVGIILTSLIGLIIFHQNLTTPTLIGIALILLGVIIINIFGNTGH